MSLGNGNSTTIPAFGQRSSPYYYGISLWDAASSGTQLPLTLASNSTGSTYAGGGIYVPNGGIVDNNNGSLTVSFIVAQWAQFENGLTVNVNGPVP